MVQTTRPILIAVVSDVHCGSTLAICPPEGVRLDDGGRYTPSGPQVWLWQCWVEYWERVRALARKHRARLWVVYNGDLFEGSHHHTVQIISAHPEPQAYLADRIFGVPRSLEPEHTFIVRGTEAHVGPSGATEEQFARWIKAERNQTLERWSWWQLRLEPHGVLIDCQHHGRMGFRPWTEANAVQLLAAQIFFEHARFGWRHPDIAIRSHYHRYGDSSHAHPVRVVLTPGWQLKTAHAYRVATESIAHVGGITLLVCPDRSYDLCAILFRPEPPEVWRDE